MELFNTFLISQGYISFISSELFHLLKKVFIKFVLVQGIYELKSSLSCKQVLSVSNNNQRDAFDRTDQGTLRNK